MKAAKFKFLTSKKNLIKLFERILIIKYGSYEKARLEIEKLSKIKDDAKFEKEIKKMLFYDTIRKMLPSTKNINFSSLLNHIRSLKKINPHELLEIEKISKEVQPLILESLNNKNENIEDIINKKIRFTKKEVREEIGFKDQETFNKWMDIWGFSSQNRIDFSVSEYINLLKKCMLQEDEDFDVRMNFEEYLNRINRGLIYNQTRLKELKSKDFKTYKKYIDFLKEEGKFPEKSRSFPYSIAIDVIKSFNN